MVLTAERAYSFEGYTLDLRRGCLRSADGDIELRPKSFEMLRHLIENAGRLVSKDELAQALWRNIVVTDESLTRCVSDIRLALGDGKQRLIKTVPRRGYIFVAPVSVGAVDASPTAPSTTAGASPAPLDGAAHGAKAHNLPRQLTSFIRKETELAEVKARLARHRLVTLIGPGGAGKTRMALEVGAHVLAEPLDGVWLVELAPLDDPRILGETLCSAIEAQMGGGRPAIEIAIGYLRQKKSLLIVDNCEHLIEAAAQLVEALMRGCPSLSILATSRERLAIAGESTYQVPALEVPPLERELTAAAAQEYDAVRLFVERASATIDGFRLSDADAPAVANICRQLDGMPLAIELAVPQLRMLQLNGIEARLGDPFRFPVRASRTAPLRHQTLATIFDWSYDLLSESERTLFRRLSVFASGWTLEAATSVASGGSLAAKDVLGLLSALVEKSLAVAELGGPEPRYKSLETTRQYAAEKLRASRERDLRRRLADTLIRRFAEASASWPSTATETWLAHHEPDLDNLRASLEWCFGPGGDAALGVELTSHSMRIWDELALLSERGRWFKAAIEHSDADTPAATRARLWLGRTSTSAHGDRTNLEPALAAADLFRETGDRLGLGEALAKAGAALATPENTAEAFPYLDEAMVVLKPLGPTKHLASCLRSLAVAHYFTRNFAAARPLIAESEAIARSLGDGRGIATAQIAAAEHAFAAGAVDDAIARAETMLAGDHYNRRQRTLALGNLAAYLLAAGRVSKAKAAALEGIREARALDWRAAVVRSVEHLALVAALSGAPEEAARLLGYGVAFYAGGTATREFTEMSTYDRLSAQLAAALPQERAAELMAEGARWSEDRIVEIAASI